MNKFLLLVLLIFVQSKKLNTFQEFGDRNLKDINEEEIEKLRNNKELKEIAYIFYDLFEKNNNEKDIIEALDKYYNSAMGIINTIITDDKIKSILTIFSSLTNEEKVCVIVTFGLKETLRKVIDLFYEQKDDELNKMKDELIQKGITILFNYKKCQKKE